MVFTHRIDFYSKIKNCLKKHFSTYYWIFNKKKFLHTLNYGKKWYGR